MKLTIRNQTCHLLSKRAVFWEEKKIVFLADIHIGKTAAFRKEGVPIPEVDLEEDLLTLTHLINELKAEKCIVVGDLIHSKAGISNDVRKKFSDWLKKTNCEIHLVIGNHDASLIKNLPKDWSLHLHQEGLFFEPFYFSHFPMFHDEWFVWSGHLHPKIEIKNKGDRIVCRCFQIFSNLGILPAFGSFVGGTYVKKEKGCEIFGIIESSVIQI